MVTGTPSRTRMLIQITTIKDQIANLEVQMNRAQGHTKNSIQQSLHEKRQLCASIAEQLSMMENNWLALQEKKISNMKDMCSALSPGERALLEEEIRELEKRVNERRKSIKSYVY